MTRPSVHLQRKWSRDFGDGEIVVWREVRVEGSRLRFLVITEPDVLAPSRNEFVVCFAGKRLNYCKRLHRAYRAVRLWDRLFSARDIPAQHGGFNPNPRKVNRGWRPSAPPPPFRGGGGNPNSPQGAA